MGIGVCGLFIVSRSIVNMKKTSFRRFIPLFILGLIPHALLHGETIDLLKDGKLDAFRPDSKWSTTSEVSAVKDKCELKASGEGKVLINGMQKSKEIPYLITKDEFQDVKIELEFMVPKNSNAGVYVMGRYEVQILDSYGRERFGSGDLGGIYQQWDPSLPKGKQGFGGVKPKVNAAKPPGEWQTMEIIFRAPRFTEDGRKIRDATFEKVMVNGELVQENATTSGHTRSAPFEGDAEKGPIAIQGDHGPIAIRSYKVTPLPDPEIARLAELDEYWAKVSKAVGEGDFELYKSTCHPGAVLVSGHKQISYPLSQALKRWKKEFDDTKAGDRVSSVEFRFSHRYGDATTAHEAGVFCYSFKQGDDEMQSEYIDFEALLVKENDDWLILMEYQKAGVDMADWDALAPSE